MGRVKIGAVLISVGFLVSSCFFLRPLSDTLAKYCVFFVIAGGTPPGTLSILLTIIFLVMVGNALAVPILEKRVEARLREERANNP